MNLRYFLIGMIFLLFSAMLCLAAAAEEGKTVSFGVNSMPGGYVLQLNNRGTNNYARFIHVAPIVNRLRITNSANNNVVYDAHPTTGTTLYLPGGSYVVTGWSSYGTEDENAITVTFTTMPTEQSPAQTDPPKASPAIVEGTPLQPTQNTTTYSSNPDYYYYPSPGFIYPYNGTFPSNNNPPFNTSLNKPNQPYPQSQLIWCTYCGKYHRPGGCAFTQKQHTVNDPYNPYWRGNK
jgi:hypothetical protein